MNIYDNQTSLPNEVFFKIFEFLEDERDFCTTIQVCKSWYHLLKDEPFSSNLKRLDRIAFENIDRFNELPRLTFPIQLRTFTVFKNIIVGESDTGALLTYDPQKKENLFFPYIPPHQRSNPGKFLISSTACIYRFSRSRIYQLNLEKQTCTKLTYKMKRWRDYTLLEKKIYSWFSANRVVFEIEVFDLETSTITQFTHSFERLASLYPCKDVILVSTFRWINVLNADFIKINESTHWAYEASHIHLIGKKLLIEGSYWGSDKGYQPCVSIKNVGDHCNYGEKQYDLPKDGTGLLHPFFIEELGWKFLRKDGIYWKHGLWFIQEGKLTCVSFLTRSLII